MKKLRKATPEHYEKLQLNSNMPLAIAGKQRLSKQRKIDALAIWDKSFPDLSIVCKSLGMSRSTIEKWKLTDDKFNRKWEEIIQNNMDKLESHLYLSSLSSPAYSSLTLPQLKRYRPEWKENNTINIGFSDFSFKTPIPKRELKETDYEEIKQDTTNEST